MNIPEWVTLGEISDLRTETQKLRHKVEAVETGITKTDTLARDADILATQAFLMGFYQVAVVSPNVRELKDGFLSTLKEHGLSQGALTEIDRWTTRTCELVEKQKRGKPDLTPDEKPDHQIPKPQQVPQL